MKIIITILFLFSVAYGQTVPDSTMFGIGGKFRAERLPTPGYTGGGNISGTSQALVFRPADYYNVGNTKRYPLIWFCHGAGEGGTNLNLLLNTSLPQLINQGLRPYGFDSVKNVIDSFIVVAVQGPNGGSLGYNQLSAAMPYFFARNRIDTSRVWVTGLSAGGSATFSMAMADTAYTKMRITGIMPLANGGWDNNLGTYGKNLDTALKRGLYYLYAVGDNDGGALNNARIYAARMATYARPNHGKYYEIPGVSHTDASWNPPFQLNNRWFRSDKNAFDIMASVRNPNLPADVDNSIKVWKVAPTEYRVSYLFTDSTVRSLYFNSVSGKVELMAYNMGGLKAIDADMGFNVTVALDKDGYPWVSRTNLVTMDRVSEDTTGAAFSNNRKVFGYFFTYATIKADSSLWYWGGDDYRLFIPATPTPRPTINKPIKLSPEGMKVVKVSMGATIMALDKNGDVWEWVKDGSTTPTKWTLPRPAVNVASSHHPFRIAIVPDATGSQTMGYPYVQGSDYSFWGGSSVASTPTALKSLWGLTQPIKEIAVSQNTIHYIDSSGRLWGMGDNAGGEVGNGYELVNKAEYPTPYAWSMVKYEAMQTTPVQIRPEITWKKLFKSNTFTFYNYAQDTNDSIYFWGRNKSFLSGEGVAHGAASTHPNVMDVLSPKLVSPIAITPNSTVYYDVALPSVNAGTDQNITTSNTTLTGTASALSLTKSGFTKYCCEIASYQWTKVSGPSCTIVSPTAPTTNVTGMSEGTYVFQLRMTDSNTGTKTDTITVVVSSANNPVPDRKRLPRRLSGATRFIKTN